MTRGSFEIIMYEYEEKSLSCLSNGDLIRMFYH